MLTRLEISGFKTFASFAVDIPPFLVVVGPNASGKSNLFDAVQLMSGLADGDLWTAVKDLRGEPHELFRREADGEPGSRIRLAAEVLLDKQVQDPWGATADLTHTRVRYEVELQLRKDRRGVERLVVAEETAKPILASEDSWRPNGLRPSRPFRASYMKYVRRSNYLATDKSSRTFQIGQDGRAGRKRPAEAAEATVLSSMTSAEFPHLYGLREELRSWKLLQLDPSALRRPSSVTAPDELAPDGHNLATVLARIQAQTGTANQPAGAVRDIAFDLAELIPGVVDLSIEEDERNREWRVDIAMRDGQPFSARIVSDGTLRVLALLTLLHDPMHRGLVCFEEPENGVHPARLRAMIEKLHELVSEPHARQIDPKLPLSQIIMNSHSPVVLSALGEGEAMFADVVTRTEAGSSTAEERTRFRIVSPKEQGEFNGSDGSGVVSRFEVDRYLETVQQ